MDFAPPTFDYPSTRYSGSKRKFLDWIWECVKEIEFQSVLDALGGTGSVALMFKRYGKRVVYNDLLKFNQIIGTAIIENSEEKVEDDDIRAVLEADIQNCPTFIQRRFQGIYFTDSENKWLDRTVTSIQRIESRNKRAILMASLFQACLAKRPFNLFHRANLDIRTNDVPRQFGNKTTWETPFPDLFQRYVGEYNRAVFSNNQDNMVVGGYNAINSPNGVDLVYLDPPYFKEGESYGTNYMAFYHFLEGLSCYEDWEANENTLYGRNLRIPDSVDIQQFTRREQVELSFYQLLERFEHNIIILSYQDNGIPSKADIINKLQELGKSVEVYERAHRYALSKRQTKELIFIGR